ncbi:MAG: DUF4919 domain-containing protein [Caulobacteraceae bacterium]
MRPALFALALNLAAASASAAVITQDAEGRYQALLAEAKANAPNVDWASLRLAYAARPGFQVFAQSSARRQMLQAANASNCKDALPSARAVIAEDYVDVDAHFIAAYCEESSGDASESRLERDIAVGLVKSIQTGDGLTAETAFTPITVDEEYAMMRALGLRVESQALAQQGGHSYDVLHTLNDKGERGAYWFLIDRVLAAEAKSLAPGAASEGAPPSQVP